MHFASQNRASPFQGPEATQHLLRTALHQTRGHSSNTWVWCVVEVLQQREPALRSNSLAANLLVPLLHVHEIRVLVDLILRVTELLLELGLVVLDVLPELGDLLVIALLSLGLLLE